MTEDGQTTAAIPSKSIPTYTDKTVIKWNGNKATIDGTLFDYNRYLQRTGTFRADARARLRLAAQRLARVHHRYGTEYGTAGCGGALDLAPGGLVFGHEVSAGQI